MDACADSVRSVTRDRLPVSGLSVRARTLVTVLAAAVVIVVAAGAATSLVLRTRLTAALENLPGARDGAVDAVMERLTTPLLIVAAALLLATCLLGVLAVRLALGPVGVLVLASSKAAADGDLPVPPGRDEVARLAMTLNAVVSRMRGAVTRERTLISAASRELRAPLAALRGEVELARTSVTYDDLQGSLSAAVHEVERLTALTDDLLLVAREGAAADELASSSVEPGGTALRPTDLRTLVPDELRRLSALVPRTALSLDDSGVGGVTALVTGPDGAWARVLANLVRDAGAAGAGQAVVRLATTADEVSIIVDDDGPGFWDRSGAKDAEAGHDEAGHDEAGESGPDPSERPGGDPSGSVRGTGMGLSIVDALVRARKGRMELSDAPDGGGRVSVTVPLARAAASAEGGGVAEGA